MSRKTLSEKRRQNARLEINIALRTTVIGGAECLDALSYAQALASKCSNGPHRHDALTALHALKRVADAMTRDVVADRGDHD